MQTYTLGAQRRLAARFQVAGVDTDPTAVTFKIQLPAGTITTYVYGIDAQLVKASAGLAIKDINGATLWTAAASGTYYVDWAMAAEGIHTWRMQGTGAAIAAEEQQFAVRDSRFS